MIGVHNDHKMHLYVFISVCEYRFLLKKALILVVQLHSNEVKFYI